MAEAEHAMEKGKVTIWYYLSNEKHCRLDVMLGDHLSFDAILKP